MESVGFDPITMIMMFVGLALTPLILMITTCFLKIAVVMVIVRNALGVQQVPPTMALYSTALVLSLFVMYPVLDEVTEVVDLSAEIYSDRNILIENFKAGSVPIKEFMLRHVDPDVISNFVDASAELWPPEYQAEMTRDSLILIIPSFVISEVQSAFMIGFLIYLPLIVIDLLVSNLLLALGMQMVSPMTVSLPLKILLFVIVDGWEKLLKNLVIGYA